VLSSHLASLLLGPTWAWRLVRVIVYIFAASAMWRLVPVRVATALVHAARLAGTPGATVARHRPRAIYTAWTAGILAVVLGVSGFAYRLNHLGPAGGLQTAGPYLGVFEGGELGSWQPVHQFGGTAGHQPNLVLSYSAWNKPFESYFADWARTNHAVPLVQLLPDGVSMSRIASGDDDAYLRSYAQSVREYRYPVIISFAPDMNSSPAPTGPAAYIAAWRHVVQVFRTAGATNVTWLWTVASMSGAHSPLAWWPGAGYVSWVGVDGYYDRSSDTFASVFGSTIDRIRTVTGKPVLISATAVASGSAQASQINGLFAGVRADRLSGLVWFDTVQTSGSSHQDWRIEDSPAGLAAFRRGVRQLLG